MTAPGGGEIHLGIGLELGFAAGAAEQYLLTFMNDPMWRIGRYSHSTYRIAHVAPLGRLMI
jgi:hypothetical protein